MENNKLSVIQPNPITTARYEFNLVEKRIMYYIIYDIQKLYDQNKTVQETLFKDLVIRVPLKKLKEFGVTGKSINIRKSVLEMRHKTFDIDKANGDWLIVGLINTAEYDSKLDELEIEISRKVVPFLFDLSKGFTAFSATVALCLKSVYSQRFYEFCNQWKDTGKWHISVEMLRTMLNCDYDLYGNFKSRVLEVARVELKQSYDEKTSEVYFTYTERKDGRKVVDLIFTIFWRKKEEAAVAKSSPEDFKYIVNILGAIYGPKRLKLVNEITTILMDKKLLKDAAAKVEYLENKSFTEKKSLNEYAGLATTIFRNDFGLDI